MIIGTYNPMWEPGARFVNYKIYDKHMQPQQVSFTVIRKATVDEYLEQLSNDGVVRRRPIPVNARFWHVRFDA
jgi:hypothetical protein